MKRSTVVPKDAMDAFLKLRSMPEIRAMKQYRAHGRTDIYCHSVGVANLSLWLACRLHMDRRKLEPLVFAAMLHDFYLYEYHGHRLKNGPHAWRHPARALENADALFRLEPAVREAIRCHMFPGTLFHMPRHAIGWVVSIADKICAISELLRSSRMQEMRVVACA